MSLEKEEITADKIISGIKNALLKCGAINIGNAAGLEELFDKIVKQSIEDFATQQTEKLREDLKHYAELARVIGEADIKSYDDLKQELQQTKEKLKRCEELLRDIHLNHALVYRIEQFLTKLKDKDNE